MEKDIGVRIRHNVSGGSAFLTRALIKYCIAAALMIGVLMLISGRPAWWQAWVYVGLAISAQFTVGLTLRRCAADLIEERSRIQSGTKYWDKFLAPIVALVGPLAMWAVAGWDVRRHWPPSISPQMTAVALLLCLLGIVLTAWAMLTNRFFSGTVRIQSDRGHVVVDRGPYARLRHPGYTGALLFTLATPAALGSRIAFVPAAVTGAVLILRTALEDRTLRAELPGYAEYAARVRSRLLPGIW